VALHQQQHHEAERAEGFCVFGRRLKEEQVKIESDMLRINDDFVIVNKMLVSVNVEDCHVMAYL
jgi:hypothetical protein